MSGTLPGGGSGRARVLVGSLYIALAIALAAVSAWPIYRDPAFLVVVVVASVVGAGVATLSAWRRLPVWGSSLVLVGFVLVLGVPLAVPSRLGDLSSVGQGLLDLAAGTVLGWKDLLTVELPVGSYRNLLVPALLVFLVGSCAGLLLAWRRGRAVFGAVAVGLAMPAFGLLFGASTTSDALVLGALTLPAPREVLVGAASLVCAVLFLAWRSRDERAATLRRAAQAPGLRVARGSARASRRRALAGAGMLLAAVLVGVAVVPWAATGLDRDVLRSAAGPELDLAAEVSPLTSYRSWFSDEAAEEVVFTVTDVAGELPDRVRIATLDSYDGEIYRAGGEDGASFVRVPSARDAAGSAFDAEVEIGAWEGVWMPTAGELVSVRFEGERAAELADAFYYSEDAAAGIETAGGGLAQGDAYRLSAVSADPADLASASSPGASPLVSVPDNLSAWVDAHATGSDGAALLELVALLRERGYLSHALTDPGDDAAWVSALGDDYSFQPSAAGHSLARIDTLFARLLEREADPRAQQTDNYVAAVGDDEQFAVAVALIAQEMGFPSRVVVGARLSSADPGVSVCDEGVCRAEDLTAWTEVRAATGEWIPIDVTPQHAQSPSLEVTRQQDPENVTEVEPDQIEEVVPPDPIEQDNANDSDDRTEQADLAWLFELLRIGALSLLVLLLLCGPFVAVLAAKAVRRRRRRRAAGPTARIAGGWEEYLDAAVDAGRHLPRAATRTEVAAALATSSGTTLAALADRASFSGDESTDADSDRFWGIVAGERAELRRDGSLWRRARTALSLRSFLRGVAPDARGLDSARTEHDSRTEEGGGARGERERRTP